MHTCGSNSWWNTELQKHGGAAHTIRHAQCAINKLRDETSKAKEIKFCIKYECLILPGKKKLPDQPADNNHFQSNYHQRNMSKL